MNHLVRGRKGQTQFTIASIGTIAIAILVVAVVIGLNQSILEKLTKVADDNAATHLNQSLTWGGNNTPISLVQNRVFSFELYNNGTIVNQGNGTKSNYTFGANSITIINTTTFYDEADAGAEVGGPKGVNGSDWITDALNGSYSYNIGSASRNISRFGISGQDQLAQFIPTIAIVAMAAVVIGILLVFFGRRRVQV